MIRPILRLLAIVAAISALASPAEGKTLVFCSEGNPETLNPQLAVTGTAMDAAHPIFNNLVQYRLGTTEIVPSLAESWTVSEDGRDYVFKLRRGVRFHSNALFTPTREFDARDVIFSLMRQWKSDHPYHATEGGGFAYFQDMGMADLLESVEAPDPYTVHIRLTRAEAPFLADLAMPFNSILSAEYADTLLATGRKELFDTQPIGTGPFMFASYRENVTIRYRVFPDYWRGRQPVDTLVFSITPTAAARLTKLKAGECHISAYPAPEDTAEIRADPRLELHRSEGVNIGYLAMNTTRPPFDDARVRRAINLAVDKATILSAVYPGTGVAATNPMPPTLWGYNRGIEPYPYDPEAARQLFTQAGITGGLTVDLWYPLVDRPYTPNGKRVAEMLQTDLGKLGIKLELKTDEWTAYRDRMQRGDFTLAIYGWAADIGDPDNFLHTLLGCLAARIGGNNIARWCDKDYNALVTEAKTTANRKRRIDLYDKAQEIFHREAPWVPIAHSIFMVATRKEVRGFQIDPLGYHVVENVDVAEDAKAR
ncbi:MULTISPECIES: ABC transporter substrate-binding protein [unclassified Aureimonas]|uniref:ABC transporter substrate-binding protein n=1 Tax=unclassified Aureimonas TaxID=2615206 RepID=UPI0006FD2E55|nr:MULTISPECIES: ABC transporter substrate-binding protein [unclassified Aureimonas]KQT55169.1 peptide ABC transporter substrate-binding protein [Aureimonas sp. Leaf427]KQT70958.1 peptide ABC transporter substrate-binding protein [Aureimonas sp. Leaf460]